MRTDRPNVLWMIVDHIAYRQYRDFFKKRYPLKNLERLSSEGMTFEKAYSVCPLCCPARASMVTGTYPHRHGITQNGALSLRNDLSDETPAFAADVKERGYRAGYFGKWHVGGNRVKRAVDYGFEGFSMPGYGNPYRAGEYAEYLKRNRLPDPVVHVDWSVESINSRDFNMMENETFAGVSSNGYRAGSAGVYKAPAEVHEAFFVAEMACGWLEERKEDGQSFVLRVDVWGPHQPYNVGSPFAGTVNPQEIEKFPNFDCDYSDRTGYHREFREHCRKRTGLKTWEDWQPVVARAYEHMLQVDAALGRVLDVLDRTGLSKNTVVMLTADHGDALAAAGGLFDKGALMIEETMSIPMVVRWPGVIKPGTRSDAWVTNMDLVPTVLELCGKKPPEHMDGKSVVPLLLNPSAAWREALTCEHHGHGSDVFQRLLYYKDYKYVAHLEDGDELYDLEKDPYELDNRIDDPALAGILREMRGRIARNMEESGDHSEKSRQLLSAMGVPHSQK